MRLNIYICLFLSLPSVLVAESSLNEQMFNDSYENTSKGKRLSTFRGKEGALEVIDYSFGTFNPEAGSFSKTFKIPYRKDQSYGWTAKLNSNPKSVYVVEFLKLPAPGNWITDSHTIVASDKKIGRTAVEVVPNDHTISHYWSIAPSDPSGDHYLKVFIDDAKPITFFFSLVKDNDHKRSKNVLTRRP